MSTTQIHDELPLASRWPTRCRSRRPRRCWSLRPRAHRRRPRRAARTTGCCWPAEAAAVSAWLISDGSVAADVRRDADPAGVEDLHAGRCPPDRVSTTSANSRGDRVVADGLGQHDHLVERRPVAAAPPHALSRRFSSLCVRPGAPSSKVTLYCCRSFTASEALWAEAVRAMPTTSPTISATIATALVRGMTLPNP